jgi:signal transduction histidine kinase
MRNPLKALVRIRFLISVAILILLAAILWQAYNHRDKEDCNQIVQSHVFTSKLGSFLEALIQAESLVRGFLVTGNFELLPKYEFYLKQARRDFNDIKSFSSSNTYQVENTQRLNALLNEKEALFYEKTVVGAKENRTLQEVQYLISNGVNNTDQIRTVVAEMGKEEKLLLDRKVEEAESLGMFFFYLVLVALGLSLVLVFINLRLSQYQKGEVLEAQKVAGEGNLRRDKIFSIVSHDLRGSASGVLGLSEMVLEEHKQLPAEELENIVFHMKLAAKKHFKLLEELLSWARVEINPHQLKPIGVLLNYITSKSIDQVKKLSNGKNVAILNQIAPSTYVWADERTLQIVLRNLILNAVHFTALGGHVKIKDEVYDDKVEIKVMDNGVGMTKDQMDNLFNLDKHMATKGTEGEEGAGMGLVFSKELLELNRGKIRVESTLGEGTTFTITLPKTKNAQF